MWDFGRDHPWVVIILFVVGAIALYRQREYAKEKIVVDAEREALLSEPVPRDIQRAMSEFARGDFSGEDQSPLAYVGYRAGKTAAMSDGARRERLAFCFRATIPQELPAKYQNWGAPATHRRYQAISGHLAMLAGQRRSRSGYRVAVGHWDEDKAWLQAELSSIAQRFGRYGYRR